MHLEVNDRMIECSLWPTSTKSVRQVRFPDAFWMTRYREPSVKPAATFVSEPLGVWLDLGCLQPTGHMTPQRTRVPLPLPNLFRW